MLSYCFLARAGLLDEEGKRAVLAAAESEFESLKLPLRKKTVVRALMDADTNTEII